jgi:hypothetical protein
MRGVFECLFWEANVLPLNHARVKTHCITFDIFGETLLDSMIQIGLVKGYTIKS